jgi:hypothetical protein
MRATMKRYKTKSIKKRSKSKSIKKGGGFPFYLFKKGSLKSKRRSSKKSKSKRTKSKSRQRGGYVTSQASETECNNSSQSDNNQSIFEASFSKSNSSNSSNNTAPPTCNYIGQNVDGTKAFSCGN